MAGKHRAQFDAANLFGCFRCHLHVGLGPQSYADGDEDRAAFPLKAHHRLWRPLVPVDRVILGMAAAGDVCGRISFSTVPGKIYIEYFLDPGELS